jgi:hypothetical protein
LLYSHELLIAPQARPTRASFPELYCSAYQKELGPVSILPSDVARPLSGSCKCFVPDFLASHSCRNPPRRSIKTQSCTWSRSRHALSCSWLTRWRRAQAISILNKATHEPSVISAAGTRRPVSPLLCCPTCSPVTTSCTVRDYHSEAFKVHPHP